MKQILLLMALSNTAIFTLDAQSSEPLLHAAKESNTYGNRTKIEDPDLVGKPSSILLVTHNHSPVGGKVKIHNHKVGMYYVGSNWNIFNQDKTAMDTNVAFNVLVPGVDVKAYVHTADSVSIKSNYTTLDHGAFNGNPNAMIFITDVWDGVYNPNPVGVFYSLISQKWCIFHEDKNVGMVKNSKYNVILSESKTSYQKFVHKSNAANTTKERTVIDHPDANNNPNAKIFITQNWNPGGAIFGTYNNHNVGVFYNGTNWVIYNEDLNDMDTGSAFNVMIFPDKIASNDNNEMNKQVNIFPNPVLCGGQLEIHLSNAVIGNIVMQVMDMSGKVMSRHSFEKKVIDFNYNLNTDNLKRGIYMLNISGNGFNSTQRFIIE